MAIVLIILFIFLRFYTIDTSLYFFNDMGRDLLALLNMIQNHKLILLGPQTSALPISQSPLYFYLLLPIYVISGQSFLTANITLVIIYISIFLYCLNQFKENSNYKKIILISFFLLSIHPQYIIQGRFVWNPSFVTPFLILGVISLYQYLQINTIKKIIISTASLAIALSLSYSVAPLILAIFINIFLYYKKHFRKIFIYFSASTLLLNLTIIAQFIKKIIISKTIFGANEINQVGNTYLQKINDFNNFVITSNNNYLNYLLFVILIVAIIYSLKSKNKFTKFISILFLLTFIITIFSPFNLQSHYIFAITTIIFLFIGSLDLMVSLPIIILLSFVYISPKNLSQYFKPATRTYSQMDLCFKNYCNDNQEPTFVSVNSNSYPYHFGPEFRYLMTKNNCVVKSIENQNDQADTMAIILDNGQYDEKTKYYELDLFGPHQEVNRTKCQDNFEIVTLSRK